MKNETTAFPKVLVIEDDPLFAEQIVQTLLKHGFGVAGKAADMYSALSIMKEHEPSIAIIDIKLEGEEDGIAIAKELSKIKWIPIIFITGLSLEEVFENGRDAFPIAFLEKPLRGSELVAQVKLALHTYSDGRTPMGINSLSGQLFVLTDGQYLRIKHSEILYIQGDRIYAKVYLTKKEFERLYPNAAKYNHIHVSSNLGNLYRTLPRQFYRLSKSFVINLNKVDRVDSEVIILEDFPINIPERSRKDLWARLGIVRN